MSARLMVFTAPVPGREEEYNTWQSEVHIPELLAKVPGFVSAKRYRRVLDDLGPAPYLTVWELSEPAEEVMAEIEAALPSLQSSGSLDVGEHRPTMMIYEAM